MLAISGHAMTKGCLNAAGGEREGSGKATFQTDQAWKPSLPTGVFLEQPKETINQQVTLFASERQAKMMNAHFLGQKLYFQTSVAGK